MRKSSAARRALSICSRMLALSTVAVRICGERDQVTAWGTLSPDWGSETGLPTPGGGARMWLPSPGSCPSHPASPFNALELRTEVGQSESDALKHVSLPPGTCLPLHRPPPPHSRRCLKPEQTAAGSARLGMRESRKGAGGHPGAEAVLNPRKRMWEVPHFTAGAVVLLRGSPPRKAKRALTNE